MFLPPEACLTHASGPLATGADFIAHEHTMTDCGGVGGINVHKGGVGGAHGLERGRMRGGESYLSCPRSMSQKWRNTNNPVAFFTRFSLHFLHTSH